MGTPSTSSDGCAVVRAALAAGVGDTPEALAHAATCDACAELLADDGALGLELGVDEAIAIDGMLQTLEARVAEVRPARPRWQRRVRLGALVAAWVVGWALVRPRPNWAEVEPVAMTLGVVTLGVAAGLGLSLVTRPPYRPEVSGWVRIAVGLVVLLAPLVPVALQVSPPLGLAWWSLPTVQCFASGFAFSGIVLGAVWAVEHHTSQLSGRWPLAAAAAAVVANGALLLHCPASDAGHMVAGHVLIGLVTAAIAYGVDRWGPGLTR